MNDENMTGGRDDPIPKKRPPGVDRGSWAAWQKLTEHVVRMLQDGARIQVRWATVTPSARIHISDLFESEAAAAEAAQMLGERGMPAVACPVVCTGIREIKHGMVYEYP